MKNGEREYRKLKKRGFSNKEIAESFVLPSDLTKKQKEKYDKQLSKYFRSYKFKSDLMKRVEKDTWQKGLPKFYIDDKGQIVKHWKNGKIEIIKKSKKTK